MTTTKRVLLIGAGWAADSLAAYLQEQHEDWQLHQCRAVSYTHLTLPTKRIV